MYSGWQFFFACSQSKKNKQSGHSKLPYSTRVSQLELEFTAPNEAVSPGGVCADEMKVCRLAFFFSSPCQSQSCLRVKQVRLKSPHDLSREVTLLLLQLFGSYCVCSWEELID